MGNNSSDFKDEIVSGTYEGNLIDGKYHGFGTYKCENGMIYSGGWNMGKRHGNGTCIYPDRENLDLWKQHFNF